MNHPTHSTRWLPARPLGVWWLKALSLALILCGSFGQAQTVTLVTHDSFTIPESLVTGFEQRTGLELRFLSGGDAGELVNRALLTARDPIADALFGIDDALIAREGARDLFMSYEAEGLSAVPTELRFAGASLTPITVGFVTLNYDLEGLALRGLAAPSDLVDLTDPAYRDATVVTDPATSSPGLAFMLTTIARFGEQGEDDWLAYWAALRDNGLRVTSGWSDAYYTAFSRYGGDRPIVLSYATSPAAEVMFAEEALDDAPTRSLHCRACAWRQIEAAGVLAGTGNEELAGQVIDFLLSPETQAAVPEAMFVYPARSDVPLPEAFSLYGPAPEGEAVATLDAERIEASQARWLEQWTQVVRQGRDPDEVR